MSVSNKNIFNPLPVNPAFKLIIRSVFGMRKWRDVRLAVAWQASATAWQPILNRPPSDFLIRKILLIIGLIEKFVTNMSGNERVNKSKTERSNIHLLVCVDTNAIF